MCMVHLFGNYQCSQFERSQNFSIRLTWTSFPIATKLDRHQSRLLSFHIQIIQDGRRRQNNFLVIFKSKQFN
jgi:hypothetical protein